MAHNTLISALAWSGSLPFLAATVLQYVNTPLLTIPANTWFTTYSLLILTFMAGALWGHGMLHAQANRRVACLLISNVVVISAWLAFLLAPVVLMLVIAMLGFIVIWICELVWGELGSIAKHYLVLRTRVTAWVLVLHAFMAILLI
ncbi:DUF3429 domain-containing protein [Bermanella sp. R86510]|uniref:DUF3429 domain-containing protein n=1 Tax=unclassified Bermanella TaxID=2627862 RepID=UPI0037C84510